MAEEDRIRLFAEYFADRGCPAEVERFYRMIRDALVTIHLNMLIDVKVVGDLCVISIVGQLPGARVLFDDLGRMLDATRPPQNPGGYRNQDETAYQSEMRGIRTSHASMNEKGDISFHLDPADEDASPLGHNETI